MKDVILLEAKLLFENGKSLKQTAKELDVNYRTLLDNLKRKGYYKPTRKSATEVTVEMSKQIHDKFNQGFSIKEIGKNFNISETAVFNSLKKTSNYKCRPYGWTKEEKLKLQELYNKGYSSRQLAKLYNCSKPRILDALENKREKSSYRKYKLDQNAFKSLETQGQAYWLGFLYADGNVGSKENSITLSLTDRESVEDFKKFLKTDKPIYINRRSQGNPKWKDIYTLTVHSEILKNDLIKLGCVPDKTYKVNLPNIDESLYRHFIRGVFDGDGSVWKSSGKGHFSITNKLSFLTELQDVLIKELGLNKTKLAERKPNFGDLRYGGKSNLEKLHDYFYKDAIVYMSRKKTKFDNLILN